MTNTTELKTTTVELATEFAKANKVSAVKTSDLFRKVIESMQEELVSIAVARFEEMQAAKQAESVAALQEELINSAVARFAELQEVKQAANVTTKNVKRRRTTLEDKMRQNMADLKNVTTKDISLRFGVSVNQANLTLKFFEENGEFVQVGKKDKEPGAVGKKEVLWSSVNA